ncbi:MAG: molybdopterin-dependent oxidoreductase [Tistlia sp.]|uniref:molybdopterin-dependent oxidoreductase n=1 Tax=Tistlia sp. TaxID=3057121 RepID=UPI0034A54FFD
MPRRPLSALLALLLLAAAPAASAAGLTVEGNIVAGPRTLTQAELDRLPQSEVTTTTSWTEGTETFRGASGQALMRSLGAAGTTVEAFASDGYSIEIPLADFETTPLLIAKEMNGAPLPEGKGPLWIVYPYDAGYDAQEYVDRSVWALDRLIVK